MSRCWCEGESGAGMRRGPGWSAGWYTLPGAMGIAEMLGVIGGLEGLMLHISSWHAMVQPMSTERHNALRRISSLHLYSRPCALYQEAGSLRSPTLTPGSSPRSLSRTPRR